MERTFSQRKEQTLCRLDLSRKGSVDRDVVPLVDLINRTDQFFTTSSCSGRIILVDGAGTTGGVQKRGCAWLLVAHETCSVDELVRGVSRSTGDAVLKFEPLVLHVRCRELVDAHLMVSAAVGAGFRNSGLTVGRTGKITAAVRSTHGLEVPLSRGGALLVGHAYLQFLTQIANQKLEENLRRLRRFYQDLQSALSVGAASDLGPGTQEAGTVLGNQNPERNITHMYKRRRRRDRRTDRHHDDESSCELDDCLDLFT